MKSSVWTVPEIKAYINSQNWYQTIKVLDGVETPGSVDSPKRLSLLDFPDFEGKTVLDVGCNSGMYSFECKRRGASRVVGVDINRYRLDQARTLAEISGLDVEFKELSILDAPSLGEFDVVICIAVLTEVTDLIGSLGVLKEAARETLYVELALASPRYALPRVRKKFWSNDARRVPGYCELRKTKNGWSLAPDLGLLNSVMEDKFKIDHVTKSLRYDLVKLTRQA